MKKIFTIIIIGLVHFQSFGQLLPNQPDAKPNKKRSNVTPTKEYKVLRTVFYKNIKREDMFTKSSPKLHELMKVIYKSAIEGKIRGYRDDSCVNEIEFDKLKLIGSKTEKKNLIYYNSDNIVGYNLIERHFVKPYFNQSGVKTEAFTIFGVSPTEDKAIMLLFNVRIEDVKKIISMEENRFFQEFNAQLLGYPGTSFQDKMDF